MALESELLGAHALGVRNILALTGDPPRIGDYPTGTGVWDVDSIGLIEILARLNRGEDQAGSPIGQQAAFTIACALDPTAADTANEWDRLERKLAAGAHLIMTQPLYDEAQVEAMLAESRRRFGAARLPGPAAARRAAARVGPPRRVPAQRGPGHHDPRRDARADARRRRGRHRGRHRHGRRAAGGRRDEVSGTYLMPSFGRYEQAAELVRRIRARHPIEAAAPPDRRSRIVRHAPAPALAARGLAALSAVALVLAVAGLAVAAGPPFPPPVDDQAVYDTAGAFRARRSNRSRRRSTRSSSGPAPRSPSTRS